MAKLATLACCGAPDSGEAKIGEGQRTTAGSPRGGGGSPRCGGSSPRGGGSIVASTQGAGERATAASTQGGAQRGTAASPSRGSLADPRTTAASPRGGGQRGSAASPPRGSLAQQRTTAAETKGGEQRAAVASTQNAAAGTIQDGGKSGVAVDGLCVEAFNELKMKKTLSFVTYIIKDTTTIVLETKRPKPASYQDFLDCLAAADGPRYALMDYEYTTNDGRPESKLCFVFWCPDDKTSVKDKMLYAASKDSIKKKLPGVMKDLQGNDMGDMDVDTVTEYMKRK